MITQKDERGNQTMWCCPITPYFSTKIAKQIVTRYWYYPKYPLMCEIFAVAICDSGYSEERALT